MEKNSCPLLLKKKTKKYLFFKEVFASYRLDQWMRNFNCYLRNVYTTPEKFENAVLFLMLDLPSTLIRHKNGAFGKRS